MGLFQRLGFIPKKGNLMMPAPQDDMIHANAVSYKTLATFDLNLSNPRFDGDIPEATIKFYPLD